MESANVVRREASPSHCLAKSSSNRVSRISRCFPRTSGNDLSKDGANGQPASRWPRNKYRPLVGAATRNSVPTTPEAKSFHFSNLSTRKGSLPSTVTSRITVTRHYVIVARHARPQEGQQGFSTRWDCSAADSSAQLEITSGHIGRFRGVARDSAGEPARVIRLTGCRADCARRARHGAACGCRS